MLTQHHHEHIDQSDQCRLNLKIIPRPKKSFKSVFHRLKICVEYLLRILGSGPQYSIAMAATEARNSRNSFTMGNDRVYNSRVEGSNSFSYPRREESIYSREESIYSRTASINSNEQTLVYSREPELYPRYPEPSPDPTPTPSPEEDELPELPPKAKSVKLVIFDNIRRSVSTVNEAIKEVKKEVTSSKRKSVVTSPVYVAPIVEGLDLGSAPGFLSATTSASVKSNTVKSGQSFEGYYSINTAILGEKVQDRGEWGGSHS